jgi:hypothetical protein
MRRRAKEALREEFCIIFALGIVEFAGSKVVLATIVVTLNDDVFSVVQGLPHGMSNISSKRK